MTRVPGQENVTYTVLLEPEEGGGYHAWCPALRGCHSCGESPGEAVAQIKDAIAGYLASLRATAEPFPPDVIVATIEVEV